MFPYSRAFVVHARQKRAGRVGQRWWNVVAHLWGRLQEAAFSKVQPARRIQIHPISEVRTYVGVVCDEAVLSALGYRIGNLSCEEGNKVLEWLSDQAEACEPERGQ